MIDLFEKCYKPGIADEARALGIYPYFHALESKQDVTVIMEGKRRIMLGSNNYLGLTTNETVIRAGVEAYEHFGSGCSGSRFLNGTLELHLELEKELAAFLRKDEVVTFSTGFQSNLGIISALVGLHDYVIMDRKNHASLYDGCRLSYMGLPTPNLCTGGFAFHGPYEHIAAESMDRCAKMVELLMLGE